MARMKFGNEWENVVTRKEFPLAKARKVLKKETVAVLGYGVQGPAQALNMRDNGISARPLKKFRKTTDSKHAFPIAPNILERQFGTEAPDQAW